MTKKRTRVAGIAATLAAIPFLLPTVAGATAGPGYVDSSNDPESYPPLPGECAGGQLWWQWVGDPNAEVLSASNPYIVLDGISVAAGEVTITEAITWDARPVEEQPPEQPEVVLAEAGGGVSAEAVGFGAELFEKMRVEFYKDGQLIGSSPFHTPDLPDDAAYAWSVSTLGTFDLLEDADKVVLAHADVFMATDGGENAFLPKSVCITSTPFVPDPAASLSYDCERATLTMANNGKGWSEFSYGIDGVWNTVWLGPGESLVEDIGLVEDGEVYVELWVDGEQVIAQSIVTDCVVPVSVATTVPPTEVLAQTEAAPQLAFTGDESMRNAGIGAALLAAGAAMLLVSRRRTVNEG